MVVFEVQVNGCNPVTIVLGRRGTYNTQEVTFDLSYLVENYGAGTAVLMVKRSQDTSAYPAVVSQENNILTWIVSDVDTYYPGSGECQLMWYVDEGLAKTIIYPMVVMKDILQTAEEPPDGYENWIEHLTELGAETQQNAQDAAQSASEAKASEDSAAESAQRAEDAAGLLVDVSATATTLDPSQPATAEYNDGVFEFGIPKGDKLTYADLTEADKEDLVQGPIKDAQDDAVEAVGTAKTNAVDAVNQAGTTQKNAVNQAGTTAVNAVGREGTTQVERVTTEGNTQVGRVQDKGDEVIASIPSDYSDLTAEVDDLSRQLSDETTGLDTKATVILETASGAIASFDDGADSMPVKKLVAQIKPVQDLHGYDNPWPAGGGKNLIKNTAQSQTINGLTITINADGSVTVKGTATRGMSIDLWGVSTYGHLVDLEAGESYTVKGANIQLNGTTAKGAMDEMITFTAASGDYVSYVWLYFAAGSVIDKTYYPQLEKGSTATSFAPYENICPISGWTGAEIEQTGVNIWDEECVYQANRIQSKNYIPVKPNTTYYRKSPNNIQPFYYDATFTQIGIGMWGTGNFTTPQKTAYIKFHVDPVYGSTYNNDISINYPATDTTYHPYTGNQISVTFPSEAGTVYGGTLTINPDRTGTLVVDRAMVDLGTLTWVYNTARQMFQNNLVGAFDKWNGVICSNYKTIQSAYDRSDNTVGLTRWLFNDGQINVVDNSFNGDVTAFKTAMNGVIAVYELATPVTYQLTESEISAILTTLYGTNNIWSNTGDVTVEYPADTKLYIDNKITQAIAAALNA